jgi:hypothetical protein
VQVENFESIFHQGAYVYTTWPGRVLYSEFIKESKAGMDKGALIMHRCHGTTSDISPDGKRAVTKMKATVTQRFDPDGVERDARPMVDSASSSRKQMVVGVRDSGVIGTRRISSYPW